MADDYIIVKCPHCEVMVYVSLKELNCFIFRHGVYKNNHTQIDPHLDKVQCDKLYNSGLIYGCSKPFKIIKVGDKYVTQICGYI
jgi:hypothetical protein